MPLLNHFRPPLEPLLAWSALHTRWSTQLADEFQTTLPPRYYAESCTRFGIEIDVAAESDQASPGTFWPKVFPQGETAAVGLTVRPTTRTAGRYSP